MWIFFTYTWESENHAPNGFGVFWSPGQNRKKQIWGMNNISKLRHAKNTAIYLNKVFILFGINKCSGVYVLECLIRTHICYFKSLSSFPVISPCFKDIREGLSWKVLSTTFPQSIHLYLTDFLFIYNIINIHYRKLKKIILTHIPPHRNKILVNTYKSFSVQTDIYT